MPPTQYVIRITADISWEGKANGLPPEISAYLIYQGDDTQQLNELIEQQMAGFSRHQMMFAQREQGRLIDLRETPQDRIAVPFRWIVKFYLTVTKLTGEMPLVDDEGKQVLQDGSEPLKQ